jgi:hypothetical protein
MNWHKMQSKRDKKEKEKRNKEWILKTYFESDFIGRWILESELLFDVW